MNNMKSQISQETNSIQNTIQIIGKEFLFLALAHPLIHLMEYTEDGIFLIIQNIIKMSV